MSEVEKQWRREANKWAGEHDFCADLAEDHRAAYRSALKAKVEAEIESLGKKIDNRTARQAVGYITQRVTCRWFLSLLETVTPNT